MMLTDEKDIEEDDVLENFRIILKDMSLEQYQELIKYFDFMGIDYEEL